MEMLESAHESKFVHYVSIRGGLCLKLNPQWFVGIPDRLLLPGKGVVVFLEMKRPEGDVRKRQRIVHGILRGLGLNVRTAYTYEEAVEVYKEFTA
jgi:hypothetical protein